MSHDRDVELQDRRGLRYSFNAAAEILLDHAPEPAPARVTELSFRGCFVETSAALQQGQPLRIKFSHSGEHFEASAHVLYVRPNGAGLAFTEIPPQFRTVLQDWILAAMDLENRSDSNR